MDCDGPIKAVIWKAEPFHKKLQLRGTPSICHNMIELPSAQDVDVTLAKERICRWRKEKCLKMTKLNHGLYHLTFWKARYHISKFLSASFATQYYAHIHPTPEIIQNQSAFQKGQKKHAEKDNRPPQIRKSVSMQGYNYLSSIDMKWQRTIPEHAFCKRNASGLVLDISHQKVLEWKVLSLRFWRASQNEQQLTRTTNKLPQYESGSLYLSVYLRDLFPSIPPASHLEPLEMVAEVKAGSSVLTLQKRNRKKGVSRQLLFLCSMYYGPISEGACVTI